MPQTLKMTVQAALDIYEEMEAARWGQDILGLGISFRSERKAPHLKALLDSEDETILANNILALEQKEPVITPDCVKLKNIVAILSQCAKFQLEQINYTQARSEVKRLNADYQTHFKDSEKKTIFSGAPEDFLADKIESLNAARQVCLTDALGELEEAKEELTKLEKAKAAQEKAAQETVKGFFDASNLQMKAGDDLHQIIGVQKKEVDALRKKLVASELQNLKLTEELNVQKLNQAANPAMSFFTPPRPARLPLAMTKPNPGLALSFAKPPQMKMK